VEKLPVLSASLCVQLLFQAKSHERPRSEDDKTVTIGFFKIQYTQYRFIDGRIRMIIGRLTLFALLAGLSVTASAGIDTDAVVGGALGGAAGAAVGSAVGGRDAAIVGGGVGGALGTAMATKNKKEVRVQQREVVYAEEEGRHDNGLHRGHHKRKHKHHHEDED
jgi:hypothetical protein